MKNVYSDHNEMPKIVSYEILKVGFFWRISLRGVLLKRKFVTFGEAEDYIPELHRYFGDDCQFYMKESSTKEAA